MAVLRLNALWHRHFAPKEESWTPKHLGWRIESELHALHQFASSMLQSMFVLLGLLRVAAKICYVFAFQELQLSRLGTWWDWTSASVHASPPLSAPAQDSKQNLGAHAQIVWSREGGASVHFLNLSDMLRGVALLCSFVDPVNVTPTTIFWMQGFLCSFCFHGRVPAIEVPCI